MCYVTLLIISANNVLQSAEEKCPRVGPNDRQVNI